MNIRSALDDVRLIERRQFTDGRGWLLKAMDGKEEFLSPQFGEIYVVMASAGQIRANHYHPRTSEWFTVVMGRALLRIGDPETGKHRDLLLDAATPQTVFIPAGVAHAFRNSAGNGGELLLLAYADHAYDPTDTVALKLL
jgi:dTDP-4-dehydrorhamnose 3,5-epimerase-like enzyme